MRELITDEMVEAAHAVIDREIGAECPTPSECAACDAHQAAAAILEAVAPHIAAATLRDAADAWQWGEWAAITEPAKRPAVPSILGTANAVTDWIRARADRIEKED